MTNTIELYLVSGFLGSGKTTFLKNMLVNFENKKVAVLVNEFGPVSIDAVRLSEESIKLVEINNGSIFCSCLKVDFLKALLALSNEDIDVLFIENSGLADPSNIHTLLSEISNRTTKKYEYRGSLCVVDASSFIKHVKILPSVQNQVAYSNFVIVNKTDKVNKEIIEETEKEIRRINPLAYVYQTVHAMVPMTVIDNKLIDSRYEGKTSNRPGNRVSTYAIEIYDCVSTDNITSFVNNLKEFTYRIKGYAKTQDGWVSIDVIEDDVIINSVTLGKRDNIDRTKIVLIGKVGSNIKDKIVNCWRSISSVNIEIY